MRISIIFILGEVSNNRWAVFSNLPLPGVHKLDIWAMKMKEQGKLQDAMNSLELNTPWKEPKHYLWMTLLQISHLGDIWDMKCTHDFLGLILKSSDCVYSQNFVLIELDEGMCGYLLSLNT